MNYRDRQRRETLGKLSKPAKELHDDLTAWLAEEDRERPEGPRPAQLRSRLALLPPHQQRYVLRLWRQQIEEIRTLEALVAATKWLDKAVGEFLEHNPGQPVPQELKDLLAILMAREAKL